MNKFLISLSIASLILLLSCSSNKEKEQKPLKPIIEEVSKVTLKDVISNVGTLEATNKVELKSEASGRIDKILVKEGALLKKGDVILKIDPERIQNSMEKLNLNFQKAQLNYNVAKRNYENAQKLAQYGKISDNQLEDLKNQYEMNKISVDEIKLSVRDLNKELRNTVITSPINGVLVTLPVSEGEIVVAATGGMSNGTAIGTIADLSDLEAVTDIGEVDYPKIKMGMTAELSMASNPERITKGKVNFISMSAKKESNSMVSNFTIRIAVDSLLEGMVPGVNMNVDLVLLEKKNVLGVPYSMVSREIKKKKMIYKVTIADDQKIRKIEVGMTDYKYYEVISGLKEGERVMKVLDTPDSQSNKSSGGGGFGGSPRR